MKKIWTSLKKRKNLLIFLTIILLFGIGIGIYFGITSKDYMENTLNNYALTLNTQNTHFAIPHFTILALLFVLSLIGIGIPTAVAYLFYEGLSIGFCGTIFTIIFHMKGLLFILLFFIIAKVPFLILFSIFFQKLVLITKSIISWIIYKSSKKDYIIHLALGCLILIIILLLYDLFLDFLGIKIIRAFQFLLN